MHVVRLVKALTHVRYSLPTPTLRNIVPLALMLQQNTFREKSETVPTKPLRSQLKSKKVYMIPKPNSLPKARLNTYGDSRRIIAYAKLSLNEHDSAIWV